MRKRMAIGVGMVAVMLAIVGPPFVTWSVRPYPPLRVGMTPKEVEEIIGLPTVFFGGAWEIHHDFDGSRLFVPAGPRYYIGPDCFGNNLSVKVHFKAGDQSSSPDDKKVTSWEVTPLPRTRPPWLDKALKWVDW
jgi:hypothetical protein